MDAKQSIFVRQWWEAVQVELAAREVPTVQGRFLDSPMATRISIEPAASAYLDVRAFMAVVTPLLAVADVQQEDRELHQVEVLLIGSQQQLHLSCGISKDDEDEDEPWLPADLELSSPERREADERVVQMLGAAADALALDPDPWEPEPADAVAARLLGHVHELNPDQRAATQEFVARRPSQFRSRVVDHLIQQRIEAHRARWRHDATRIAQELLEGPEDLKSVTKSIRTQVVYEHLRRLDPCCASRPAAEPVVLAIATLIRQQERRRSPGLF